MVLWKFSFRELLQRPGRATLTLLSIVIGVGIVVSVSIATSTTRVAYRDMFATVSGRAALEVVAEGGGVFDRALLEPVRQVPGVRAAVPVIQRLTIMYAGGQRTKLLALGVDPAVDGEVRNCRLVAGRPLDGAEGILLETDLAQRMGIAVGDEVKFLTRDGMQWATVVGLVASPLRMSSTALMPLDEADAVFGLGGRISAIQVVLEEGADEEAVRAELARRLPEGIAAQEPATRTRVAEETMQSAELGLELTGGFSLLLAMFIMLNTCLMNVGERRRQLAILRALGATRRQVAWLMYRESLAMAAVGVVLGIAVGLAGGHLLMLALDRVLLATLPPVHVSAWTLVLAGLMGLGIAVLGAAVPARRAGRLSPLEGMRTVVSEDIEGTSHRATIAGAAITLLSGLSLAACILGWLPVQIAVSTALFLLLGLVLLMPTMLAGLSRAVVWLLQPLARVESTLAHRQILRHRGRSTLTVGVLFVASATGVGMASTILDNIRDVRNWYQQAIVGDFFVRAMMPDMATGMAADLPEPLGAEIRNTPGVAKVGTARFVQGRAADQPVVVIVREFAPDQQLHLNLPEGERETVRQALCDGQVVLGTVLAQRTGLGPGDEIPVETCQGTKPLRIMALTNDYLGGGLVLYMQRDVARRLLAVEGVDAYVIKADPQALDEVRARLETIAEKYGVLVESSAEINRTIDGMVAGIDGCLWGTLVLGFLVAAFGTINTLGMNVLEQTRELGLLRAVAMTRGQVRKTILAQAAIFAGLGLVPGTISGVGVAYLINLATMTYTGHPVQFQLHPWLLVTSLAASLAIVLVSAALPAERAARLELAKTLQYE